MSDHNPQPGPASPVSASASRLMRWMGIPDANSAGAIHGGTVMRFVDEAAAVAAIKHSGRRVVTAGMDRMTFVSPVYVGELLCCSASVNAVWRTSMEVGVRVEAENPYKRELRHTSTAYLTLVALDDEGTPTAVPRHLVRSRSRFRRRRSRILARVTGPSSISAGAAC